MAHNKPPSIAEARLFLEHLRAANDGTAPPSLLGGVLAQIGAGDRYAFVDTLIGPLFVAYNEVGISTVIQADGADEFERAFRARFKRPIRPAGELPADLADALKDQLTGTAAPDVRFDLRGLSEFERDVLLKAREIPRGEVRPYSWIAGEIGRPKAVRAVGTALGNNPVPLLIPCHRVVRSDGRIGEYILGTETKRAVLKAEGLEPDVLETIARAGVRYYADESDHTFCYPTCGGIYKRASRRYVTFHSAREATAAGFSPCADCRPAYH